MAEFYTFGAKRISLVLAVIFLCALGAQCGRVALVVEDSLYSALGSKIDRLEADVAGHCDTVFVLYTTGSGADVRNTLIGLYNEPASLEGALLVGDIPVVKYEMYQPFEPTYEKFVCDLFYMDMDGTWSDNLTNSPFQSGVLDGWSESSNETIEIWVSRIKTDNLSVLGTETDLMSAYLDRNHAGREDVLNPHRGHEGLVYNDDGYDDGYWDDWTYWTSNDVSNLEDILGTGTVTAVYNKNGEDTTRADFLYNQVTQDYHALMLRSHGSYSTLYQEGYHLFRKNGVRERIYLSDYVGIPPAAKVYSLYICKGACIGNDNYIAAAFAFHPQGGGLILWATSKTLDKMIITGANCPFYTSLAGRSSVGQSFVSWFNQANIQGYNHYGLVLLGDASISPQKWNYLHLSNFAANWKSSGCSGINENCQGCDVTGPPPYLNGHPDGQVNVYDLVYLVDQMDLWLN